MKPSESFERKNITELGLELSEPQKFRFDSTRDISTDDMNSMKEHLKALDTIATKEQIVAYAARLHELDPSVRVPLTIKTMSWEANRFKRDGALDVFATIAFSMKRLGYPYDPKITDEERRQLLSFMVTQRSVGRWEKYVPLVQFFQEFDPELSRQIPGLKPEESQFWNDFLRQHRNNDEWMLFADSARALRVLDSEFDPELTDEDWRGMSSTLDDFRRNQHWMGFVNLATAMKRLAGIGEKKQPVQMPVIPPVPETKAYTQ